MHIRIYIYKIFFVFHIVFGQSQFCNYFDSITVRVKEAYGYEEIQMNGCFKSNSYITEIYVYEQQISRLGKNAVIHLLQLQEFALSRVDLEEIEPQAFKDLPKLTTLQISSNIVRNISEGVFQPIPSIQRLLIFNNKIEYISSYAFSNLPKLKEVQLQNNALVYWNRKWFENSTKLEELYLDNNRIRTIPSRAFTELPKLRRIDLTGNKITTIESDIFEGAKKIGYLNLAYNKLTDINHEVFPMNFKIGTLHINGNYLNFLSNKLLKNLNINKIYLDFNPWECSCLFEIYRWITSVKGKLMKWNNCDFNIIPVCAYPEINSQMCRGFVDEELTLRYIGFLKNISVPMGRYCAMLD